MVQLRGLMVNRLIVLLQVFIFPAYFYIWMWVEPMRSMTLDGFFFWGSNPWSGTPEHIILRWIAPLIFALPFSLVSAIKATRVANSYDLMWRALGKVRIDTKIFYMVNAMFCLFFLILPFAGPLVAVFGAFFAVKLILYAFGVKKNVPAILIVIPGLFLAAIPLIITIAFFAQYNTLLGEIWQIWANYSPVFYGIVLCLACAIAVGNFFVFLREGASQVSYKEEVGERIGTLIKILLFAGFLILYLFIDNNVNDAITSWKTSGTAMLVINIVAVSLSVFETIIRWRKKTPKGGSSGGAAGSIMVPIFIAMNFFIDMFAKPEIVVTIVVALSAVIFFALFIVAYKYSEDETLFEE
ncbi:MAG: hypothetical protein ACTSQF_07585 [Candidatus Heimdallarchaeaceae archaeon]